MKNRKIITGFLIIGLFLSSLTLLTTATMAEEETRAGSVNSVAFYIRECTVVNDKYALGHWEVNVTFTVAGDSISNAKIKVEISSDNSDDQNSETPGQSYLPGNKDIVCNTFNFTIPDQYTIIATISYDEGGPDTHQEILTFQEVVDYSIDNISLFMAPYTDSDEYGIFNSRKHIINADITNIGNHMCTDTSTRAGARQVEQGLTINITVKTGGVQEDVAPGELNLPVFQTPEPGESINLAENNLNCEWRPSKEATFTIEIRITDECSDTEETDSTSILIKNVIHITMAGVKTEPVDTVLQGQAFEIIVDLNTSGSNCDPVIGVAFEIKDGANNMLFKNNLTQAVEPMGGAGGGGTGGSSAIMSVYFTDVIINEPGAYTIYVTVTDPALSGSTTLEVTQIDNDAPVIEDTTVRESMSSLRKDDTVYFKLKFTDTKYTGNVQCWVCLDEGDIEMFCDTDELSRNYSVGEIFKHDWSATGGENNYTLKVTDGILNVSTVVYNFFVLDVPPGYGMVKGEVRNGTTGDPIAGANVRIENKKLNGNTTEVLTNATGHYQAKLEFGTYKIRVSKSGYSNSSWEFQILEGKDVEVKDFQMSAAGAEPVEYGYLIGYVQTVDKNGTGQFVGGANIKLSGGNGPYWGDSENGTGKFTIKPMSIGVPVGNYTVTIEKKGYKTLVENITIIPDKNEKYFDLYLKDDEGPVIADSFVLTIQVMDPYDAQVLVDGESREGEDDPPGIYYLTLARGSHYVEVIMAGYETYKNDDIDLMSNERIEVTLKKIGADDDDDIEPPVSSDSIKIKDNAGNAIVGAVIEFKIGNITYKETTNSEGIAKFNITIPLGTKITITKDGEERPGTIGDGNTYTWIVETKDPEATESNISPTLIYIIIGIVLLVVIFIISFIIIKKRGGGDEDDDEDYEEEEEYEEEEPRGPSIPAVKTVSMGSCSKCGTVAPQGTTFCPQCGNNMKAAPTTLACRGCGTQVNKGIAFCPNCGMSMTQNQLPVAGMQPVVPQLPQQATGGGGFGSQAAGTPPVQQQGQARLPPGPAQNSGPSLDELMASATVGSSEPPLPPPPE